MRQKTKFGSRTTADKVLAGIDLTGKHIVVTGCNSGIGLETTSALAANGAHVIAAAQTRREAELACQQVGYHCSPLECDLSDLQSVDSAAATVRLMQIPLDAVIANAGVARLAVSRLPYGVEEHFLVNHIGHFALVNGLAPLLRAGTGRVVIVTSRAAGANGAADAAGIKFDNLAGQRFYEPEALSAQSKLANALYAKELSRRLQASGIAVNTVNPGEVRGTSLGSPAGLGHRLRQLAFRPFMRTPPQGAATIALLAASPSVNGISGHYWQNCAIARGHPLLDDADLAGRLWALSEEVIADHRASRLPGWAQAA